MNILENVTIILPESPDDFGHKLINLLSDIGVVQHQTIFFRPTSSEYFPKLAISFVKKTQPQVEFHFADMSTIYCQLINTSGQIKRSPERYTSVTIDNFIHRLAPFQLTFVDHIGFNLPWFDGVHPEILELRKKLCSTSLYYLFPSGAAWDFILPGTTDEIRHIGDPNLNLVRRPKFELVSFNKSSTPLIQIEIITSATFAQIKEAFPEGIAVSKAKNVWIYIENNYGIDVCLVLNQSTNKDWSSYFSGHRMTWDT